LRDVDAMTTDPARNRFMRDSEADRLRHFHRAESA
jgi:hypothetical protein